MQLYPYIQSTVPVSDGGWLGVNISFLDHKHILAVSLVHEIFSINYQIHAKWWRWAFQMIIDSKQSDDFPYKKILTLTLLFAFRHISTGTLIKVLHHCRSHHTLILRSMASRSQWAKRIWKWTRFDLLVHFHKLPSNEEVNKVPDERLNQKQVI